MAHSGSDLAEERKSLPLLLFAVGCLVFFFGPSLFTDPDTPWHLAGGELTRSLGYVPDTDHWSFASEGAPWYNLAWLWDLLIYEIDSWTGLNGVFLFSALFKALIPAVLAWVLLSRPELSPTKSTVGVTLAAVLLMMCLYHSAGARPQLASYLFVVIFHALLHFSRSGKRAWKLGLLPLLMLLWANLHGGFLTGFLLYGAYGIEALFTGRRQWLAGLVASSAASIPCVLFGTPLGLSMVTAVERVLGSSITAHISEWKSFSLFSGLWGFDVFLIVWLLVWNLREKRLPWADRILTFGFLLSALFSLRHFPIFAVVSGPFLALRLNGLASQRLQPRPASAKEARFHLAIAAAVPCLLALALAAGWVQDRTIDPKYVPIASADYLRRNHPGERFINEYVLGGFLIYYNHGVNPVFADGRAGTGYGEETLKAVIDMHDPAVLQDLIEKYSASGVIAYKVTTLFPIETLRRDPRWELAFEGTAADVYLWRGDKAPDR